MELDPLEDLPPPPPKHSMDEGEDRASTKTHSFTYTAKDIKDVLGVLQRYNFCRCLSSILSFLKSFQRWCCNKGEACRPG